MKKVVLTGVTLMAFAAASFAQNYTTLSQVGNQQTSSQNQSGNNLLSTVTQGTSSDSPVSSHNQSFTDQRTTNNTTTVTQTTSQYNQALVFQNTGSTKAAGGAQNEATIQQIGSGTTALFSNPNSTPAAGGTGTGNVARIGQEDEGNHASIQQNGAGAAAGANNSNYGRIDQFHGNNGLTTNDVYIHQNGVSNGNVASISEQSGAKTATIEQNGLDASGSVSSNNTASINQSSPTAGVQASIQQNSGGGDIFIDGSSSNNLATINQTGGKGIATIQQNNGSGNAPNSGNQATVNQSAGAHTALITQNDDSQRNVATVTQDGSGTDNAQILQTGFSGDGTATIHQGSGNTGSNTALIQMQHQTGTVGASSVTINQNVGSGTGDRNNAVVLQGYVDPAESGINGGVSSKNRANIDQHGSRQNVNQYQVGVNNQSDITQTGSDNTVQGTTPFRYPPFAAQLGQDNTFTVTQDGIHGNVASLFQNGIGNTATVNQVNTAP